MYEREEVCAKWRYIRGPSAGSPSGKRNWAAFLKAYKTGGYLFKPPDLSISFLFYLIENLVRLQQVNMQRWEAWWNRKEKVTLDLLQNKILGPSRMLNRHPWRAKRMLHANVWSDVLGSDIFCGCFVVLLFLLWPLGRVVVPVFVGERHSWSPLPSTKYWRHLHLLTSVGSFLLSRT